METEGEGGRIPMEPKPGPTMNGQAAATPKPQKVGEEAWLEVEKGKITLEMTKAVMNSPNLGKAIEAFLSAKAGSSKHTAEAREKIAQIQAKHAYRANFFFVAALLLCLLFLSWVIYYLRGDKETLLPVLSAVISLIAGTGGGYVFGRQSVTGRSE